jgi:hypothetical protein
MGFWIPPPSFSWSIAHASRTRPFPFAKALNGKIKARRLLEALGLPIPGDFRVLGGIADLKPAHFDRPCAIKPDRGADNRGFLPLVPEGRGKWRDLAHDVVLDFDGIRAALAREVVGRDVPDRWVAEELLVAPGGGLPNDVKYLTFRGEPAAQFIRTNVPKRFKWFDEQWTEIESGLAEHTRDASIEPPHDVAAYTSIALRVSGIMPLPFVRVDFLETDRGDVVGELTPFPGWAHRLTPELDARLGARYEATEKAMLAEALDWRSLIGDDRLLPFAPTPRPAVSS